jgi:hypothetical protein
MKAVVMVLALVGFGLQASAESYTSCTNGKVDEVGDLFYQIDLYEDGISFFPYEGEITLDAEKIGYADGTFSIINQNVGLITEGESYPVLLNAILTLNEDRTELNAAISLDQGTFRSLTLNCEQK